MKPLPLTFALLATTMLLGGGAAVAQTISDEARVVQTRDQAEARAAAMFTRMDANQDGALTAADREAAMRKRFDAADADGNGELSFAEMTAMHEERREARGERGGEGRGERRAMRMMRGHEGGPPMGDAGMGGRGMGRHLLEQADADGNGAVTGAEFTAAALARFDAADADNSGTLTAAERRAARQNDHRMGHREAPPAE